MLARLHAQSLSSETSRHHCRPVCHRLQNLDSRPAAKPDWRYHHRIASKVLPDFRNSPSNGDGLPVVEFADCLRRVSADDEESDIRNSMLNLGQNIAIKKYNRINIRLI